MTPAEERKYTPRRVAIMRLWRGALRQMRFRHPDPSVDVQVSLHPWGPSALLIRFDMYALRDNVNPDRRIGSMSSWSSFGRGTFHCEMLVDDWPGLHLARMAATATWMGYINHEALELVSLDDRIYYDPHRWDGCPAQRVVNTAARAPLSKSDMQELARFCFDRPSVDTAIETDSPRRDLEVEEGWVLSGEIGG